MKKPRYLSIITVLLLQACSSQQVYEAIQSNQTQECQKVPQQEYEACMERVKESYEAYLEKRETVIKSQ